MSRTFDVREARVGRPIRPNAGIQAAYRRKLMALIDDMYASLHWWLLAEYKRQLPRIREYDRAQDARWAAVPRPLRILRGLGRAVGFDASPAVDMRRALRRRYRQWQRTFDDRAGNLASWFVEQSLKAATASVTSSVAKAVGAKTSALGVEWQMTRATNNAVQSIVAENVALIKNIPTHDFLELEGLFMRAVRTGYDAGRLTEELERRYGITTDRARFISRDQLAKATESLSRVRMQEIGIEEAVWVHTAVGKTYRGTHVRMNGRRFRLDKGLYDSAVDRWVQPGELPNCHCTKAPIIPGMAAPTVPERKPEWLAA